MSHTRRSSDRCPPPLAKALELAQLSVDEGGMPFGAVILQGDSIIAEGRNRQVQQNDIFAHAEMDALKAFLANGVAPLTNAVLVATEAPCLMCAGAALNLGIRSFIVGEDHHFKGAVQSLVNAGADCHVVNDQDCIELVSRFRTSRADLWNRYSAG